MSANSGSTGLDPNSTNISGIKYGSSWVTGTKERRYVSEKKKKNLSRFLGKRFPFEPVDILDALRNTCTSVTRPLSTGGETRPGEKYQVETG